MNLVKNIFLALAVALTSLSAIAQPQLLDPVAWSTSVEQIGDGEYRIDFKASVAEGWHMYDLGPYEGGPAATTFTFDPVEGYELVGGVTANRESAREMNDIFEMVIGHYEGEVTFSQVIKTEGTTVQVVADWMACNDENCITGDKEFSIKVGTPAAVTEATVDAAAATSGGSIWGFILSAMGWALIALLTPCVFPMIPMTVSFFLKGSGSVAKGRFRALMYGLFIVVLYTVPIGVIIFLTWLIGGDAVTADIFNWLSTHWLPNILFFVVFMVFAASFFGAFEIVLPEKLVNNSDSKADKGGLVGIFFMALTLVLVSFSCTGPIIGSALIQSTSGEVWTPIITMFAFSVVFALPFTLFALFPSWLKQLPKSGGWLNSVKVVLGFVELALGMKFLSVADQTYHWGLLDREVYLAIWIAIFSLLGLYLLGKLKFKHDSDMPYLSVTRLVMSIIVFSFVVYMIPGMFGAPLNGISGYLPPMTSQDFRVEGDNSNLNASVKYGDKLHLPHNLKGYFDLEEAIEVAKKENKPIFVDITGHACNNCREMETRVWSDPRVKQILMDDYIICALYVDDRTDLKTEDYYTNKNGIVMTTLGRKNNAIAVERFNVNAQPGYVLMSPDQEILMPVRGYDASIEGFIAFLEGGKAAMK